MIEGETEPFRGATLPRAANDRRPKALVLADAGRPFGFAAANLGDRAIADGLYRLLGDRSGFEVLAESWKAFPYVTCDKLAPRIEHAPPTAVFEDLAAAMDRTSDLRVRIEDGIGTVLAHPWFAANPLLEPWNRRSRARRGLNLVDALTPYLLRARQHRRLIERIAAADLVVLCGGGLMADHIRRYAPSHLLEAFIAKGLGKPVIACTESVCATDPALVAMIAAVYGMLDLHIFREPLSRKRLMEMGIPESRIRVAPDTAFAVRLPSAEDRARVIHREAIPSDAVAIIARGDVGRGERPWAHLATHLRERHGRPIYFLHTCRSHDEPLHARLRAVGLVQGLSGDNHYPDLLSALSAFSLVITDRFHACVFALLAGTPVVPLASTTFKTAGLFRMFDYAIPVQPAPAMETVDGLVDVVDAALRDLAPLRRQVVTAGAALREQCHQAYDFAAMLRRIEKNGSRALQSPRPKHVRPAWFKEGAHVRCG